MIVICDFKKCCSLIALVFDRGFFLEAFGVNYQKLISQAKRHEGKRLDLHKCPAGYWSIGYGHNLEAKGISQAIADQLLLDDLAEAETAVRKHISIEHLNDARIAVLINMSFKNLDINAPDHCAVNTLIHRHQERLHSMRLWIK